MRGRAEEGWGWGSVVFLSNSVPTTLKVVQGQQNWPSVLKRMRISGRADNICTLLGKNNVFDPLLKMLYCLIGKEKCSWERKKTKRREKKEREKKSALQNQNMQMTLNAFPVNTKFSVSKLLVVLGTVHKLSGVGKGHEHCCKTTLSLLLPVIWVVDTKGREILCEQSQSSPRDACCDWLTDGADGSSWKRRENVSKY